MPKAIVLQHVAHEGPGSIAALLDARGFTRDERHLYAGDAVPAPDEPCDLLVVMGGAMGVGDLGDPRYPFMPREVECLRPRLRARLPTLGICLGSQLMAHAAGARVYRNVRPRVAGGAPERIIEVGFSPTQFHLATRDPALAGIAADEVMLHWHGDTYDLPQGATLLASTPLCPHQAFSMGKAYALQFHPELDAETLRTWVAEDAPYVAEANGADGAGRLLAEIETHLPRYREVGDRLLGNILDAMGFAVVSARA